MSGEAKHEKILKSMPQHPDPVPIYLMMQYAPHLCIHWELQ